MAEVVSSVFSTRVPVCNSMEADNLLLVCRGQKFGTVIKRNKPSESTKMANDDTRISTLCLRAVVNFRRPRPYGRASPYGAVVPTRLFVFTAFEQPRREHGGQTDGCNRRGSTDRLW